MNLGEKLNIRVDLQQMLRNTRRILLGLRGDHGHWEGELSSSALSTATAVIALEGFLIACGDPTPSINSDRDVIRERIQKVIHDGRSWLVRHQNSDGGWGDTTVSFSNISTTALVWSALHVRNISTRNPMPFAAEEGLESAVGRCEAWIVSRVGGLEPEKLAKAITARYGRDKTFSVPILTTLALTDRLGSQSSAWRLIPQLPFELAAFPPSWFAMLNLPVVSYALPALIAMGQVHHVRGPTWNPILRWFRSLVWDRTQRVLVEIQPSTGGFLEATPLTSFVLITLLGAHAEPREVIDRGVDFLLQSVRKDGSWPIDTNLATWTTTLSINALAKREEFVGNEDSEKPYQDKLSGSDWDVLRRWVAQQQYQKEHPYTHARPGGWAWTDLAGGVPDADDTSGALLAIRHLATGDNWEQEQAWKGAQWLLDLQNSDGGIPTFCKGWGALPFDRSSTDITAHAIRAWIAWVDQFGPEEKRRIERGVKRASHFLNRTQSESGTWSPLWFGNQSANPEENLVYGTSRVLLACAAMFGHSSFVRYVPPRMVDAIGWLLKVQNSDGGWGAESGIPSSIEETALVVESLCEIFPFDHDQNPQLTRAIATGLEYLVKKTHEGREFAPSPIGFYFAKLWYYEKMYPVVYTLAALESASRLGFGGK